MDLGESKKGVGRKYPKNLTINEFMMVFIPSAFAIYLRKRICWGKLQTFNFCLKRGKNGRVVFFHGAKSFSGGYAQKRKNKPTVDHR